MQYFFFTNSSRISIGKLTCNQNHRSVLHIARIIFLQRRETTEKALSPGNATDRVAREFHRHADLYSTDRPNYLLSEWQRNAGSSTNDTSANLETIAARQYSTLARDTILMDISKCATTHHRYFSFLTLTLRRVLAEDRFLLHLPRRSHVRTRNTGNRGRRMSRQTSSLSRSLILFKQ